MKNYSEHRLNPVLIFSMWLFVAVTCGDGTDHETKEQKQAYVEWRKYNAAQLTQCSSYDDPKGSGYVVKTVGYLLRDGKKVPMEFYEGKDPQSENGLLILGQWMTPTPEEKAEGITLKYEGWIEPKRYRAFDGEKWSEWQNAIRTQDYVLKMGRVALTLQNGNWTATPISDELLKGDCNDFKKMRGF
jgi:hypothetical protein